MFNKQFDTPPIGVSHRVDKYLSFLGTFPGPAPLISKASSMSFFMLQASQDAHKESGTSYQQPAP